MRRKDLRAFQILEEFLHHQTVSQRWLARKLNVSVGLMNATLKALEGQGLFTVEPHNGNRNRYILTAEGIAEKTRLNREYLKHSLYYYGIARTRIKTQLAALEKDGISDIGFCGVGFLAEIAYICLQQTQMRLIAVIADEGPGDWYFEVPVIPVEAANNFAFDMVLITAIESVEMRISQLHSHGVAKEKVQLIWH